MAHPRILHTATVLDDGRVLVAGGHSTSRDQGEPVAELYDPASGTWAPTGRLAYARVGHSATRLADGRVLVAGGRLQLREGAHGAVPQEPDPPVTASDEAEIFDPATGTWSPTGKLTVPRVLHTANLLPSGEVLVVGGSLDLSRGPVLAHVESFDSRAGRWSARASLPGPRDHHAAIVLGGEGCGRHCGALLVIGGAECRYCLLPTVTSTARFQPDGPAPHPGSPLPAAVPAVAVVALVLAGAGLAMARRRR